MGMYLFGHLNYFKVSPDLTFPRTRLLWSLKTLESFWIGKNIFQVQEIHWKSSEVLENSRMGKMFQLYWLKICWTFFDMTDGSKNQRICSVFHPNHSFSSYIWRIRFLILFEKIQESLGIILELQIQSTVGTHQEGRLHLSRSDLSKFE